MSKAKSRIKLPDGIEIINAGYRRSGAFVLVLTPEQLTTVHRALERHAECRDPEVDPDGIAGELAEMIREFVHVEPGR